MKCKRCGRELKSEESKLNGYGPTCFKKMLEDKDRYLKVEDVF